MVELLLSKFQTTNQRCCSVNMLSSDTSNNIVNMRFGYPIPLSELEVCHLPRYISGADRPNVIIGYLRIVMSQASRTSFALHNILHIICVISKVEVIRIYTRRIIALVKDLSAGWNLTSKDNPRCAMGIHRLTAGRWRSDLAISFWHFRAHPKPASLSLFKERIESLLECSHMGIILQDAKL
jgi:hypothetical protein